MSIDVPTAGSPILDSWGVAVAGQLNRCVPLVIAADEATNSATAQDIDDWSFAVVAGSYYNVHLSGTYQVSATNQGLLLGVDGPAGSIYLHMRIGGNGAAMTFTETASSGSLAGSTSTDSAATRRTFQAWGRFAPTADGTITIQYARGGTSGGTGVTIEAGAGGILTVSDT